MLSDIIGSTRYFATMRCLTNDSVIASLYVIADFVLFFSLAACAIRLWGKRSHGYLMLPYQCRLVAIVACLLAGGYLLAIVTLFEAAYRFEVLLRGAAAGVAAIAAFSCWSRP